MDVPSNPAFRALLGGLLALASCAKSDVPIDGPTSPVSGTLIPGAAAPGTVNLETAPAMQVQVTLSSAATASDVMTLTVREALGNGRVTASRNAVQGGGVIAFDPIDVTALDDGQLLLSLDLSNAAGTTRFTFPSVLKDTVPPAAPTRASIPADPGSGMGSIPANTINLLNDQAVQVEVELTADSSADDVIELTFTDGTDDVRAEFAAQDGPGILLAPPADLSGLADGLASIEGAVVDRANNRVEFDGEPLVKDTVLGAPLSGVVAEGLSNPEGYVNLETAGAAVVRVLFPEESLDSDVATVTLSDGLARVTAPVLNPLGGENSLLFENLDLSGLADGSLELMMVVEDSSGNYAERPGTLALKDTVIGAPALVGIEPGPGNAADVINAASVGSVVVRTGLGAATLPTDRLTVTVSDGLQSVELERAALAGPTTVTFAPLDTSGLADGTVDVTVTLEDAAGNRREAQLADVPKDTLPPSTPAEVAVPAGPNNPPDYVNALNQATATVRLVAGVGADPDRRLRLRVVGGGGIEIVRNRNAPAGGAVIIVSNLDLSTFPEGLVGLEVVALDAVGNSSPPLAGAATLDRSIAGPSAAIVPAGPGNDENVITAAIEAAVPLRVSFPAGIVGGDTFAGVLSDGSSTIPLDEAVPAGGADLVLSVDTSSLADGMVELGGSVSDLAGNSAPIGPFTFDKDTTSPGAPLGAHVRAGVENDIDVINLTSVGAVEVEVELPPSYDGTEDVTVVLEGSGGGTVAAPTVDAPAGGGSLVFGPLDASGLAQGTVGLTVEVTDASQNTAAYAGTSALKDTVLPEAPTSAGVAAGPFNPADTINATSLQAVEVVVDLPASYQGDELVSVLLQDGVNPPPVSPRLDAPAGGGALSFTGLDASGLLDGTIQVTVKLADAAGNELDAPTTPALKDVIAPEVDGVEVPATLASAPDTVTAFDVGAVAVDLTWGPNITGAETAVVRVEDGSDAVESASFPTSQTMVTGLDLGSLADGPLTLSVTVVDGAANETRLETPIFKRALRSEPRFTFVAGPSDGTLSVYHVEDGARDVRPATFGLAGGTPEALAVDYGARVVHVADSTAAQVLSFRIDPLEGHLEPLGSTGTGADPAGLAVHPSDDYLVVASRGGNKVEVFRIDVAAGTLTPASSEAAGSGPSQVVANPSGRFVHVADSGTNEIWTYPIDPATGALSPGTAEVLANAPTGIAVHPSGEYLYVGRSSSITGYRVDAQDGSLTSLGTVAAPSGDVQVAVRPDGRFLYTVSAGSSSLNAFRIDGDVLTLVSGPVGLSGRPSGIAVDPSATALLVTSDQSSELYVFDLDPDTGFPALRQRQRTRGGAAVAVSGDLRGVLRSPRLLYAVHASGESLGAYAVDPSDGSLSISGAVAPVGQGPRGLAIHAAAGLAFVVNESDDTVTRIRLDAVTGEPTTLGDRAVGADPYGAVLDLSRRFLYVSNGGANSVSMLAVNPVNGGLTAIAGSPIPSGPGPGCITADPTGQFVYVVNRGDGSIGGFRVDPATGQLSATPVASVPSGGVGPVRAAVHPSGRTLYVTNAGSNSVSAFRIEPATGNLTSLGQPVPAGNMPGPIAVDPLGEYVLVGNAGAGDLSVYEVSRVTGSLVTVVAPPAVVGGTVGSLTIDPTGRFVHASEPSADLIAAFTVNRSNLALTLIEAQGAAAGQPSGLGATGAIQ